MCLAGLYSGVFVTEHQLLSPDRERGAAVQARARPEAIGPREQNTYLRSAELRSEADAIDLQLRQGAGITHREAYERLLDRIRRLGADENAER
jgi:hypothetical protein